MNSLPSPEKQRNSPPNDDVPQTPKNGLSWPMLALILVTGGGNFLATHQSTGQLSAEQHEVFGKIRELHRMIDEFEDRQKQELQLLNELKSKLR